MRPALGSHLPHCALEMHPVCLSVAPVASGTETLCPWWQHSTGFQCLSGEKVCVWRRGRGCLQQANLTEHFQPLGKELQGPHGKGSLLPTSSTEDSSRAYNVSLVTMQTHGYVLTSGLHPRRQRPQNRLQTRCSRPLGSPARHSPTTIPFSLLR